MLEKKDRKYEPSPSLLGSCPRKLVYYALDTEKSIDDYAMLRARRGTAIHLILPDVIEYVMKHDERFSDVESYKIIKTEGRVIFSWGQGTYDVLMSIVYKDGRSETIVVDLKNYARAPEQPYDSNVQQIQAYVEGCIQNGVPVDYGLLIYFPDSGEPVSHRVDRDPNIDEFASNLFAFVKACVLNDRMPERLLYSDKRCSMCDYRWTCWDEELTRLAEMSFKEDPVDGKTLPLDIQNKLLEFIEVRNKKEGVNKEYKEFYGEVVKLLLENELFSVNIGEDRLTLVKCKRANGQSYYQLR